MVFEFAHLSQFLEEQQSVLLAQLEKLDGDILRQRDAFDVLVSEEICRFSSLISELEEKNGRPARELLTVRPPHPQPPLTSRALPFTLRAREVLNSSAGCPHRPWSLCILASHCPMSIELGGPFLTCLSGYCEIPTGRCSGNEQFEKHLMLCKDMSRAVSEAGGAVGPPSTQEALPEIAGGPSEASDGQRDWGPHSWFTGLRAGALASSRLPGPSAVWLRGIRGLLCDPGRLTSPRTQRLQDLGCFSSVATWSLSELLPSPLSPRTSEVL